MEGNRTSRHHQRVACVVAVLWCGMLPACGADPQSNGQLAQAGTGGTGPVAVPNGLADVESGGSTGSLTTSGDAAVPPVRLDATVSAQPGQGALGFVVPPDSAPEKPLPICKRQIAVANNGALAPAVAAAVPGDCLVLADGAYDALKITLTGTPDAPIVIRAANRLGASISDGQLILQGSSYVVLDGINIATPSTMKLIDCQFCRITRSKLVLTVEDDWLLLFGNLSQHNRIDHCEFGPKLSPGPMLVFGQEDTMSHDDLVDHNYFHDNGPPAVNEKETVRIGWSSVSQRNAFTVVEYNLFENCDGDPEIVSVKTNQNIVRYNTVRTSTGVLSLRHGNGSFLYGNFILGGHKSLPCTDAKGMPQMCNTGGIRVYGSEHAIFNNYIEGTTGTGYSAPIAIDGGDGSSLDAHHQVVHAQIVANTVVDNVSGIEIGRNYTQAPRDSVVAYNVVRAPSGAVIQIFKPQSSIRFAGNVLGPTDGMSVGASLSSEGALVADPGLAKEGELWKLAAGSPAIDLAAPLRAFLLEDIDGQTRAVPDAGCDERADGGIKRRPLTAADVGPGSP